jgi:hypothetical protein
MYAMDGEEARKDSVEASARERVIRFVSDFERFVSDEDDDEETSRLEAPRGRFHSLHVLSVLLVKTRSL